MAVNLSDSILTVNISDSILAVNFSDSILAVSLSDSNQAVNFSDSILAVNFSDSIPGFQIAIVIGHWLKINQNDRIFFGQADIMDRLFLLTCDKLTDEILIQSDQQRCF
jgi:hypothetical protein